MSDDFLAELETTLSSISEDKMWKRTIGGVEIWFIPTPYDGSLKVNEVYADSTLGGNVVLESKRTTLSYSIVGFDNVDLRPYRGQFVFPKKNPDGKVVKTSLTDYLYRKILSWPGLYVDDVFEVLADLMETYRRENLIAVEFENKKTPREELSELESRAAEIREELGMPQMVEAREFQRTEESENESPDQDMDYHDPLKNISPFARVPQDEPTIPPPPSPIPAPPSHSVRFSPPVPAGPVASTPMTLDDLAAEDAFIAARPARPPLEVSTSGASSTDMPYRPVTNTYVAEERAPEPKDQPPVVFDQVVTRSNINPRFSPPRR